MLRAFVLAVVILINYILKTTLFPHIAIMGVTPDTTLVLIVSYAILRNEVEGALFGLFAGLMLDISGMFIGIFALLGFLVGYICGKPFKDFFKDNYFLPFFVVVGVSFAHQFVLYVTTILLMGQLDFWHYMRNLILPKTVYTASLSIPLYGFMHFVNERLTRRHTGTTSRRTEHKKI